MNYKRCLDLLGVKSSATQQELQLAYRKRVRVWHPDRFQQQPESMRVEAEVKMQELNKAYSVLQQYLKYNGHLPRYSLETELSESEVVKPYQRANTQEYKEPVKREERTDSDYLRENRRKNSDSKGRTWVGILFVSLMIYLFYITLFKPDEKEITKTEDRNQHYEMQQITKVDEKDASVPKNTAPPSVEQDRPQNEEKENTKSAFESDVWIKGQKGTSSGVFFTYGDRLGKVYEVQGIPTRIEGDIWYYGESEVHFKNGKVTHWINTQQNRLKAKDIE